MAAYNLMKAADRASARVAYADELKALERGYWPRDVNDQMRWRTSDRGRIRAILVGGIAYLDSIPARIAAGELAGWQPSRKSANSTMSRNANIARSARERTMTNRE